MLMTEGLSLRIR